MLEQLSDKRGPHGLPTEPTFLRLLHLERRRTERSRQPFVLMLVERQPRAADERNSTMVERIVSALLSSIRETDVAGWYKDQCLGVIFAEVGARDKSGVIEALRTRMTAALRSRLRPGELDDLRLSFHWFPEETSDQGSLRRVTPVYSEVVQRQGKGKVPLAIKRAIDIAGSALALIVLSPVLLVIGLVIKLTSSGPVIFRQERLGQHGVGFTFLKFRSMYSECDPELHREFIRGFIAGSADGQAAAAADGVVYKLTQDPRVTPVGRFLRKTSLDELPQLFNVLKGEMSLVGPRPPIPYELEGYDLWHRRRFLEIKPGITGLWQVTGRSRLRFDDMVRLDLKYARTWSIWLDIKILLRTARVVLSGAGAH